MKKIIIALLTFSSLQTIASSDYTGEKILDYIPTGLYSGPRCSIEVDLSSNKDRVSVAVQSESDYANFNTSLLTQEDLKESIFSDNYQASFILVPDDGYSGYRSESIEIKNQNKKSTITVEMKRRHLGFWKTERKASCTINRKGNNL